MLKTLTKKIQNTDLTFTNQRALFWEEQQMLILSDLHVGKSAHFRRHGIPVPAQVLLADLQRLQDLMMIFEAEQVVIVGDLFHAGYNSDLDVFKDWRKKMTANFILVKGNHDRLSCEVYEDLGLVCHEEQFAVGHICFSHHPVFNCEQHYYISGHIHPGVVLQSRTERLRLPCFAVSENQLILPAFSKFTGLDTQSLSADFAHIAFGEGTIFEV